MRCVIRMETVCVCGIGCGCVPALVDADSVRGFPAEDDGSTPHSAQIVGGLCGHTVDACIGSCDEPSTLCSLVAQEAHLTTAPAL